MSKLFRIVFKRPISDYTGQPCAPDSEHAITQTEWMRESAYRSFLKERPHLEKEVLHVVSKTVDCGAMKPIKEWDIIWIFGSQCLVGITKRPPSNVRPGDCFLPVDKEVVTSEIAERNGNKVKTISGSVYTLVGDRKRKVWEETGLLSVGGPKDLELREALVGPIIAALGWIKTKGVCAPD